MRSLLLLLLGSTTGCSFILDFGADIGGERDGGQPDARTDCNPADLETFYSDSDMDEYGDPDNPADACEEPPGHVADLTDCDDGDELVNPGRPDVCNGIDDDCSDTPDDGQCLAGCADGEREGFIDAAAEPDIAGCSGGFALPGLLTAAAPACDNGAGDDGDLPAGDGCNASDLCGLGWHVCASPGQVAAASATGNCTAAVPTGSASLFFATRQSGGGGYECEPGADDLFGCGDIGVAVMPSCAPLDRSSGNLCATIGAPWVCGADNIQEANNVTKSGPAGGGVLCCRD